MVKVEGPSPEEMSFSGLVDITKEIVRGENLEIVSDGLSIGLYSDGRLVICTMPLIKLMSVEDRQYFDIAHDLASAYEGVIGNCEFRIQKKY